MTTALLEAALRHKALMYVFGRRVPKIVDVVQEPEYYRVKCEDPMNHGRYYWRLFWKQDEDTGDTINTEIKYTMDQLNWIAAGNEFPTK